MLHSTKADVEIEISIPGGEQIAQKNAQSAARHCRWHLHPRHHRHRCSLFLLGVDSRHPSNGIDVARAEGLTHVAGATGTTSEAAVQKMYSLPESALIDMGDFAGGMLKYLRRHPVERVSIAGGFAKMTKLAQGMLDLHSRAGSVDMNFLAELAPK